MKSKIQSVFFSENQLIKYLRVYGPKFPSKRFPTDDEEIVFAIWTKRVLETETDKRFLIAFELNGELEKLMPNFNPNLPADIKELFDKHVNKHTLVDFALALERKPGSSSKHKIAFAFQLKIIEIDSKNYEKRFVEKINHYLLQKYPKLSQDISLLVVPQIKSSIYVQTTLDVEFIKKHIKPTSKSFEKIFILWAKKPYTNLTEIFPKLVNLRYPNL